MNDIQWLQDWWRAVTSLTLKCSNCAALRVEIKRLTDLLMSGEMLREEYKVQMLRAESAEVERNEAMVQLKTAKAQRDAADRHVAALNAMLEGQRDRVETAERALAMARETLKHMPLVNTRLSPDYKRGWNDAITSARACLGGQP